MTGAEAVPPPVRVLVVDDQQVIREGLTMMLGLLDDLEVVGAAVDGDDALRQIVDHDPDVVLMDLKMPGRNGIDTIRAMKERGSRARVVVMTTYDEDEWVFPALRAGALGFLTKDVGAAEIRNAIVAVAAGRAQLDPVVQRKLLDMLAAGAGFGTAPAPEPAPASVPGLTARECEILDEIVQGLDNNQIAERLSISLATVKTHINHLLSKTGCTNRAGLVIYAYEAGRVDPRTDASS